MALILHKCRRAGTARDGGNGDGLRAWSKVRRDAMTRVGGDAELFQQRRGGGGIVGWG